MIRPLTIDEKISIKGTLSRYGVPSLVSLDMDQAVWSLVAPAEASSSFTFIPKGAITMARTRHPKYTGAIASARAKMESKVTSKKKLTLQLTLNVTYLPNGTSPQELQEHLEDLVTYGTGEGLLTAETEAVVESYRDTYKVIPEPVKEKKSKGRFHEGSTQVCAHRVSFYYRLPPRVRISKDELFRMTEAAEERAQECIVQGYVQGELNYETERVQATGWWRIDNG
ncbi:MAG: hypothetical protein IMZ61_11520 [Planctomycetes bacterium]|nr:hypothetical protein [Planctomycetota bacterium]